MDFMSQLYVVDEINPCIPPFAANHSYGATITDVSNTCLDASSLFDTSTTIFVDKQFNSKMLPIIDMLECKC
jgi:hypothetical protein